MLMAAAIGTDLFRALLQGAPPGGVYALIALGFVLTYKTSGVFNLAFGAQAYVSAAMYFKCRVEWGWGIVPSVLVSVVILAPALGLLLERLIFRYLRSATAVAKLVVTIGLSVAIPNLFDLLINFKPIAGRTPVGIVPGGANVFYDPFGVYAFSRNELVTMGIAVVATLGLLALFKFSAVGLRMRAVVESPRMTELNGVAADRVSAFAWALSSLFAGLAGVLIAPRFNTLAAADFFYLVVVAIAAAAIGRLVSLPWALVGGLGLGVLTALINTFLPRWTDSQTWLKPLQDNLAPAVPFLVLFATLVFVPSLRRTKDAGDPLSDVDPPQRSIGAVVRDRRTTLVTTGIGVLVLVIIGVVVFGRADARWLFLVTQAAVLATVFLSITLVTGLAGQISLCQGAFAAIGAFTVFQLVQRWDVPVLVAAVVGALIAAVVGALLSLPIRKLGGVWTAIATLAFAYFFDAVVVKLPFVGGGEASLLQGTKIPRPVIGPFDFRDDRAFLVLTVIVFAVLATVVVQLRAGTFGRMWVALRGSDVGAESIGISPAKVRLVAFALSAAIAAVGGALMAMLQKNVNYGTNFSPFVALFWVVLVVTLSSRTVEGAAMAAASFSLFDAIILKGAIFAWLFRGADRIPGFLPISPKWVFVLFGLGAIQYARHPEGLLEYQKRKRALKAREKRERKLALAAAAATSTSPHPDGDVTTTTVDAPAEATAVDEPASVAGEGPGR
jgi:branched-chain amino acid transport system permease protein